MSRGVLAVGAAFVCWGFFPLYFRLVPAIPAWEVLANRIVWSLVLMLIVLALRRHWGWIAGTLRSPRVLGAFVATALLIAVNWVTYMWAVTHDHVLDASLGYFMTPLVNVALGYAFLGERPRRAQWTALGLAAAGVLWLAIAAGRMPWIGLVLALSFGGYGLLRKVATLGALEGLALETALLAPIAAIGMAVWWRATPYSFPAESIAVDLWYLGLAPLTTVPLFLFAWGARQIPLTTVGLLQYIAPSMQFVMGVTVFGEPFGPTRLAGFVLIWLALALYSWDGWRRRRLLHCEVPVGG